MRKDYFFLSVLIATTMGINCVMAQNYNITFAILGSSDKPTTVKVENITQGTERTLNGSDVLNLVTEITGIDELKPNAANTLQVYPNPVGESATLSFNNPKAGNVSISVVSTTGVQVASCSTELPKGEASCILSGLEVGNYIVSVQSDSYRLSCVVISNLTNGGKPQIVLNNAQPKANEQLPTLKAASPLQTIQMEYTTGDVLKFTANLSTKEAILDNYIATQTEEVEFSFSYTVKFNDYDNTELSTFEGKYGEAVTYPTHPGDRAGYTANGWDSENATVPANDDLVITAQYETISYNVTYHNVGTKNQASNPATYTIETADITLAAPADSVGFTFGGWFTDAAFSDTISTPAIAQGSMGNNIFYAKWLISPVTDIDGNVYKTIAIGTQIWMTENLKVTQYADGTPIPLVTDNTIWGNLGDNETDKAYCFNDNDENLGFGALYTYAAATNGDNSGNNVQGVCPTGWHLPSNAEWTELTTFIGNDGHNGNEGTALKATSGWYLDGNGTDDYGFAALPGGYRHSTNGAFEGGNTVGSWWSSTEFYSAARSRNMVFNQTNVSTDNPGKSSGLSVRCVMD